MFRYDYKFISFILDKMERWYFHWVDWLVFATMLSVSAGAGLWQYRRVRKVNTEDYLLGGKSLGVFPVSASLVAR